MNIEFTEFLSAPDHSAVFHPPVCLNHPGEFNAKLLHNNGLCCLRSC